MNLQVHHCVQHELPLHRLFTTDDPYFHLGKMFLYLPLISSFDQKDGEEVGKSVWSMKGIKNHHHVVV